MKKKILIVTAITCLFACVFAFGACSEKKKPDEPPAHIHNYQWVDNGDGTHKRHCNIGGCDEPEIDRGAHNYVKGKCVCGSVEAPSEHKHSLTFFDRVEAKCEKDGNIAYWYCAGCKKFFTDEAAVREIKEAETVIPRGHDLKLHERKPATCKEPGWEDYYTCSRCDYTTYKEIPALGGEHDFGTDYFVDKRPTCTETGIESRQCRRCGASTDEKDIPALGHAWSAFRVDDERHEQSCTRCGEKQSENHKSGDECSVCHFVRNGTAGLSYELNAEKTAYTVVGIGEAKGSEIVIPSRHNGLPVTAVAAEAFAGCENVTSITIPETVSGIGHSAFACPNLTDVRFNAAKCIIANKPQGIDGAFAPEFKSSIAITVGANVTVLPEKFCFIFSSRRFVPDSTYISVYIAKIERIDFEENSRCEKIEKEVVYEFGDDSHSLKSIFIPKSVKELDRSAFYIRDGSVLESITVEDGNENYYSDGNCLIERETEKILLGCKNSVIPDGVKAIQGGAFRGVDRCSSITVPASVTSIDNYAFEDCRGLTIYCEAASKPSGWKNGWNDTCPVVWDCKNNDKDKDGYAYAVIDGVRYSLKDGVATVIVQPRNCTASRIPASVTYKNKTYAVTSIEERAFYMCYGIDSMTVADSVTTIGDLAFGFCKGLKNVTIPNSVTSIGEYVFDGCPIENATVPSNSIGNVVNDSLKNLVVTGGNIIAISLGYCKELVEITVPRSTTKIVSTLRSDSLQKINYTGDFASWCGIEGLEDVDITKVYFGDQKLADITSLEIPDGVTSVADYAFAGCDKLASVTIPNSVTTIGEKAFEECPIESASMPSCVISAFPKASLRKIVITGGEEIVRYAFNGCKKLSEVTLTEGLKAIGDEAFYYCTGLTSIDLPDSVTTIGNSAFNNCTGLTSIDLPDSVMSIGNSAFNNCTGLTSIDLSDKLTTIGKRAFYNCSGLTSIDLPDSVKTIGSEAFYNCSALTSIVVPENVTTIDENTFIACRALVIYCEAASKPDGWSESWLSWNNTVVWDCKNNDKDKDGYAYTVIDGVRYSLKDNVATVIKQPINIENANILGEISYKNSTFTVTSITDEAFEYFRGLMSVTIPNSIKSIGYRAFFDCSSLKKLELPVGLVSIGINAFFGCDGLAEVTIPKGLESIGDSAFMRCSNLTSVTIPDSVVSINDEAFHECGALTIYCEAASKPSGWVNSWNKSCPVVWDYKNNDRDKDGYAYVVVDGVRYSLKDNVATVINQTYNITSANIPAEISYGNSTYTVTKIIPYAFYDRNDLTAIELPDTIASIGDYAFVGTGYYEYGSHWENGVLYIGKHLIEAKTTLSGEYTIKPGTLTVADSAFHGCGSLTSISVSDSVTSIGKNAFSFCRSLTSMEIPNGVASIEEEAFYECNGLTRIVIPDSVMSIGESAFYGCNSLTSIEIPNGVTSIGESAFSSCSGLTSIVIPSSVTSIGISEFRGCSGLTSIEIPDGVTSIGDSAFSGCSGLTSITIPDGVASVGSYAFYNCSGLASITLPDSVTSIGDSAFSNCDKLKYNEYDNGLYLGNDENMYVALIRAQNVYISSFTIHNNAKFIYESAFCGCSSLTSIEIPGSVTSIGNSAFYGCSSLTSIEIPSSVTSIGNSAFYGCSSLTSIEIPSSVTSIGSSAFYECRSLTIYCETESQPSGWNSYWNNFGRSVVWDCKNNDKDKNGYAYTIVDGVRYSLKGSVATVIGQPRNIEAANIRANITYKNSTYRVTSIEGEAFRGCSGLTSIEIPDGVTSIGDHAFSGCSSLTSIEIPNGVTSIGWNMFYGCSGLTSIEIPDGVTSIGDHAFSGCSSLTSIEIPNGVTYSVWGILRLQRFGKYYCSKRKSEVP